MKISFKNENTIPFGNQIPAKKSYSAMKKYYYSMDDTSKAREFENLENRAKYRLHKIKSKIAFRKILDLLTDNEDEVISVKDDVKYIANQSKNTFTIFKEVFLSAFYALKKVIKGHH